MDDFHENLETVQIPLENTYVEAWVRDWDKYAAPADHDRSCRNFRHCFINKVSCTHCGWDTSGSWNDDYEGMGWHPARVQSWRMGNPIVLFGGSLFHPKTDEWRAIVPDGVPLDWA